MISLIQTAEGALNETHAILQRMRELAVQSSNDTNTDADRQAIQEEVNQLSEEITRVADTTEFNTQNLLGGDFKGKFHIGANAGQNINVEIKDMSAQALKVSGDGEGVASIELTGSHAGSATLDLEDGDHTLTVVDFGENIRVGGEDVRYGLQDKNGDFVALADSDAKNFKTLSSAANKEELSGATFETYATKHIAFTESVKSGNVTLEDVSSGTATKITATGSVDVEGLDTGKYTVETTIAADSDFWDGKTVEDSANSVLSTISSVLLDSNGKAVAVSADDTNFYAIEDLDLETQINTAANPAETFVGNVVQGGADAVMKLSAATSDGAEFTIKANGGIDVSSQEAADAAITTINNAIETVSAERSKLGAVQNRLDHTINNLGTSAENLTAAESRIRDVDYDLAAA